jgi:hypothetical protein
MIYQMINQVIKLSYKMMTIREGSKTVSSDPLYEHAFASRQNYTKQPCFELDGFHSGNK